MDGEMNADAELLETLLNEAPQTADGPLSAKLLRYWTGYAIQTISDYKNGRLTIPIRFWRAVFRRHADVRIADLILGDHQYELALHDDIPDLTCDRRMFAEAIDAMGKHHQVQVELARIFADGRVDEADADTMKRFNHAYLEHRRKSGAIHKAVNTQFARACARRQVS